jgi:hypothetical protein
MGNFSPTKGGVRSFPGSPKLFDPGGGLQGFARAHQRRVYAPEAGSPCALNGHRKIALFSAFFGLFQSRLAVVAGLAQALVVCRIHEEHPVSAERNDVVNHACSGSIPLRLAGAAERLPHQLRWSEFGFPDRLVVPTVPLGALTPFSLRRFVFRAVAFAGQLPAFPARPERFLCHPRSPPGKTKSAQATSSLPGKNTAQALVTLDAGTGASIFTMLSCLHSLHLQGRFRTDVSGRIFSSFPLPHRGQMAHPSFTSILPHFSNKSNSFFC